MEGTINAPDFPEGLQWLNTDRPLSLHLLVYHCREGQEGLCYLHEERLTLPIQRGGAGMAIPVSVEVR